MKNLLLICLLALVIFSCKKTDETPLLLPPAAEPSAKIYNDRGIKYFYKVEYSKSKYVF